MSQFVSALELATYFNGTTDLADLSPEFVAQADLLLQMISADVEAAAGIPIDAGSGVVLLPGTWSRDLVLPNGPIRDVTAVTVNGVELTTGEWWWNDRTLLRRGASQFDGDGDDYASEWSALGMQGASWRSGFHWGGPASTIAAAYSWGFLTAVPDIVKSLTLRVAARTFGNVGQVTQESLAVYSVSYRTSNSATDDGGHVTAGERKRLRRALGGTISGTATIQGR